MIRVKRKHMVIILFSCFIVKGRREWKKLNLQQVLSRRDNSATVLEQKGRRKFRHMVEGG